MAALTGNYISLFAGVGGFDLAVRIAFPRTRCVCLVENEVNAAAVLAARIKEGSLDDCPIWSDVRTFAGDIFRGRVAGVIGGFPCTDLSVAGRQAGIHGEHSGLWFEYLRIIREVQPQWVAIENVPAVIAFPAGGIVLSGLAESGFNAEWLSLRASNVGAAHGRNRVFILAHRQTGGRGVLRQPSGSSRLTDGCDAALVHAARDERHGSHREAGPRRGVCEAGNAVADSGDRLLPEQGRRPEGRDGAGSADKILANTDRAGREEPRISGRREGRSEGPIGVYDGLERYSDHLADADSLGAIGESGIVRSAAPEGDGEGPERQRDGSAAGHGGNDVADAECTERGPNIEHNGHAGGWIKTADRPGGTGNALGNTDHPGLEGRVECGSGLPDERPVGEAGDTGLPLFAPGPGATELWQRILRDHPYLSPAISTEAIERLICDLDDGLAAVLAGSRTDGLRACGNGIVAAQAALALTVLARRLDV